MWLFRLTKRACFLYFLKRAENVEHKQHRRQTDGGKFVLKLLENSESAKLP